MSDEVEQAASAITLLAQTRFPSLKDEEGNRLPTREKVERLEDYMVQTAQVEADLVALKLACSVELESAEDEWVKIEGWEPHLRRPGKDATQADVERAKGTCRPDLWETMRRNRRLISKANEGIDRMERDSKRCSRIYTFLTGT